MCSSQRWRRKRQLLEYEDSQTNFLTRSATGGKKEIRQVAAALGRESLDFSSRLKGLDPAAKSYSLVWRRTMHLANHNITNFSNHCVKLSEVH